MADPFSTNTQDRGWDVTSTCYSTNGNSTETAMSSTESKWVTVTVSTSSSTSTHTVHYVEEVYHDNTVDVKELRRKAKIQAMKRTWRNKDKDFKPMKKLRPASLKGVCFNGRGWA
jgi:hypothetical protein